MHDYDLIIKYKGIMGFKFDIQAARKLGVTKAYMSNIKKDKTELSRNIVKAMYKDAGDEIAIMWGRLQEEKVKRGE